MEPLLLVAECEVGGTPYTGDGKCTGTLQKESLGDAASPGWRAHL